MKCKEAKILLSASIDGELTPSEELVLEHHVSSCAMCAKDKAEFMRVSEAMPLWADAEPSPWLAEKFACKLAELQGYRTERMPRKGFRWGIASAATASFAAAVLVIGLLIHGNVPPVRQATPTAPTIAQVGKTTPPPPPPKPEKDIVIGANPVTTPAPVVRATRHAGRSVAHYTTPVRHAKPQPEVNVAMTPTAPSPAAAAGSVSYGSPAGTATIVAKATISENLGEASLAMNDTIERVRGNLQKSVDLMVSVPPVPVTNSGGTP